MCSALVYDLLDGSPTPGCLYILEDVIQKGVSSFSFFCDRKEEINVYCSLWGLMQSEAGTTDKSCLKFQEEWWRVFGISIPWTDWCSYLFLGWKGNSFFSRAIGHLTDKWRVKENRTSFQFLVCARSFTYIWNNLCIWPVWYNSGWNSRSIAPGLLICSHLSQPLHPLMVFGPKFMVTCVFRSYPDVFTLKFSQSGLVFWFSWLLK